MLIGMLAAACATSGPQATSSNIPAPVAVTSPPTAALTATAQPTDAPATKKPRKTKKPKPTPTPETWTPAYLAHVCAAIGYLSDTQPHLDEAAARVSSREFPKARAEAYEIVSLSVQATGEINAAPAWAPGSDLKTLLATSASTFGHGASHLIDGMAAIDFDIIGAAQAEMSAGRDQLAQARAAVAGLAATYGPAGC